jgi:hypothetical protein
MADVKPYVPASGGFYIQIDDGDRLTLPGGLTAATDIALTGGAEVTGLPATPGGDTAAVSSLYLSDTVDALGPKRSVRGATTAALPAYTTSAGPGVGRRLTADANGALDVDGISDWAADERFLHKNAGASHADHGIFVVIQAGDAGTPWILERATDFDENAEVFNGADVWVAEGTANAKTLWTVSTLDDITVDTTAIAFEQTGGDDLYTGGDGVSISAANVVAVDLATNPGLKFTSNQLDVSIKNNTLNKDGDGLYVQGVPSLFTINDVAVSANVTAANLATLTAGSSSDADTLHTHNNVVAEDVIKTVTAVESIADGDPVTWSNTADKIHKCTNNDLEELNVIGIALEAIAADGTGEILTNGTATGVLSGATANDNYFIGDTGGLALYSAITVGRRLMLCGVAKNATDLEFTPQYLGQK